MVDRNNSDENEEVESHAPIAGEGANQNMFESQTMGGEIVMISFQ